MAASRFVRSVWTSFIEAGGLEGKLLQNLQITSVEPGRVRFKLDIEKHHTNRLGMLHGGTIATLVDLGGSLAIASRGFHATGVSTDLSVTYINSGGTVGQTVRAETICEKYGKSMAFTSITFHNEADELVARGSHTKYIRGAWNDPRNIVEEVSK
ncbi:putative PaaI_thioesterase family protein [Terfezia boudieri ATCC MYA-4762]|uniref:Putative PaaI_thioesterase family protein n=1 Tax=Terfezia boudieri ATCC MYA-4762 TaxID=1051890 RepID=A0A3N4LLH2_9PEZI|nr:putative PaaI_thioesterase family protein [Terfezia boudieri ATCC MYA-4762]